MVSSWTSTIEHDQDGNQDMRRSQSHICIERRTTDCDQTGSSDPTTRTSCMCEPESEVCPLRPFPVSGRRHGEIKIGPLIKGQSELFTCIGGG